MSHELNKMKHIAVITIFLEYAASRRGRSELGTDWFFFSAERVYWAARTPVAITHLIIESSGRGTVSAQLFSPPTARISPNLASCEGCTK